VHATAPGTVKNKFRARPVQGRALVATTIVPPACFWACWWACLCLLYLFHEEHGASPEEDGQRIFHGDDHGDRGLTRITMWGSNIYIKLKGQ
jgi:hypothetical protein